MMEACLADPQPRPEQIGWALNTPVATQCKVWGNQCGQAAADEFCKKKGHWSAKSWTKHNLNSGKPSGKSSVITNGGVCTPSKTQNW
jgi:hypothetical protein